MILLIDNYDSFTYNIFQGIAKLGVAVKVIRNDKISLAEIEQMQPLGIVLSPGPGRPENAGICLDVIGAFSGKIPILGICLGHQAISLAFGGKVIPADQVVHGKETLIFHTRTGLYLNMPLPFEGARYHSLIVDRESLPKELIIEAESFDGVLMGIRHREHQTYGIQFHPESVLTPAGERLFKNYLDQCEGFATGCAFQPYRGFASAPLTSR